VIVLVHKNKKKPGDGTITFPDLQCWNPQTLVATIIAEINGSRINCRIKVSDMKKAFSILLVGLFILTRKKISHS
jgi:hypothetical protein